MEVLSCGCERACQRWKCYAEWRCHWLPVKEDANLNKKSLTYIKRNDAKRECFHGYSLKSQVYTEAFVTYRIIYQPCMSCACLANLPEHHSPFDAIPIVKVNIAVIDKRLKYRLFSSRYAKCYDIWSYNDVPIETMRIYSLFLQSGGLQISCVATMFCALIFERRFMEMVALLFCLGVEE